MAAAAAPVVSAPPARRRRTKPVDTKQPNSTLAPLWLARLLHVLPFLLPANHPAVLATESNQPRVLVVLELIRAACTSHGKAHDEVVRAAAEEDAVPTMVELLGSQCHKAAALVAVHALVSERTFREAFAAEGTAAIVNMVAAREKGTEREGERLGGGSPAKIVLDEDIRGEVGQAVWSAAIRTLSKLMVCSAAACAVSIDTGALAVLATAARSGQPMDIRLRAAAGLAAIAAWSGPRRAVEIVETEDVVSSMTAILTEQDERIPRDLRTATMDGLVVMSFRRHARRILQKHGAEEKMKAAARDASVSGDYAAAARSTVAAGQISGRSIDEYGFLVEDDPRDATSLSFKSTGDDDSGLQRETQASDISKTGLAHIQEELLAEPYISVDDFCVLEEIVHEEAGVLSSSPNDRKHVRRAARAIGVSADEIHFITALEDELAGTHPDGPALRTQSAPSSGAFGAASLPLHSPVSANSGDIEEGTVPLLQGGDAALPSDSNIVSSPEISPSPGSQKDQRPSPVSSHVLTDRNSGSSPYRSSAILPTVMEDPDVDRNGEGDDGDTSAPSSKSKLTSPLLMFSSATKRAAERDSKNNRFQKTDSQLNRETENERVWREVIENRSGLLAREKGRSNRVIGYRELALVPVPSNLRRQLWPILLDTATFRANKPNLYATLCRGVEQSLLPDDIEHTIEADVTRTMPLHSLFWSGGAQVGVQSLRSILRAYARYVPDVGYCQGMSSIAAVLIMNAADEEEAFLMMVQFMSRFQYKKVFAPGFPLMMHWISELKPLVTHYMSELNAHMERENVNLELYADKWLITALSHNFPHRYLLRIWDLMFLGGSPKIILKACLAVLKKCEAKLMTMDFDKMMPFLQRGFAEPEAGVLDSQDPEPFITMMREFRFLPDLQKSQGKTDIQKGHSSQTSRKEKRERRRVRGCLCFRRSRIVD